MKVLITSFLLMFIAISSFSQKARVIKLPELQKMMESREDTTYVINFMATWCKPCMEELPVFEKVSVENSNTNVSFIYISLDPVQDLDKKLNKLIEKRSIKNKVFLLDETEYNTWINKIEKSWDGAIPVTFIINNPKKIRNFIPTSTTYKELTSAIKKTI